MSTHEANAGGAVVEIEEYAKRGEKPPKAASYLIRIDKEKKVVTVPTMTGREILGLVGKTPEGYRLYEHLRGKQSRPVEATTTVDFTEEGVERFSTMPRDPTEGREAVSHDTPALTREFRLPEADEEYLNGLGLDWETLLCGGNRWLILHGFAVPPGYNHSSVKVALLIPTTYPDDQLDMMWFYPSLSRTDGRSIGGLSTQEIRGETFQRWSRHRTGANPWRAGIDDVSTHLTLVDDCLRREFLKG